MLSLRLDKTGDLSCAGVQRVYFIAYAPGVEDFEIGTIGSEGVFGEGALEMLE